MPACPGRPWTWWPFVGSAQALGELAGQLARLKLRPGDSVLAVDNTPNRELSGPTHVNGVAVLPAADRGTLCFARNLGSARGSAPWIVFLDADTEPPEDLLDR
jgi:hypothetical protein